MKLETPQQPHITSQLRRWCDTMRFVATLVLSQARQVFDGCLMIAQSLLQSAHHEVVQRRRIGHQIDQALAVFDHFGDLETKPATFLFTKDRVGSNVELEDAFDFAHLRAARDEPDYKDDSRNEHHHDW